MGAACSFAADLHVTSTEPLVLRYQLHVHSGAYDPALAKERARAFSKRPGFWVKKSKRSHQSFDVGRLPQGGH